jgi:MFS family permease
MPTNTAETRARLFDREYLPLAIGAVALVTLGAFENRAVGAALPTLVQEFDALSSFGLATAAPLASFLVALAVTGLWCDRRGPVPALRTGALAFALAQLMVGTAPSMHVVIAGRVLSGLAEGLIDVALIVLVARTLPAALRPRMFSLFAAMWILPSVFGPLLTGVITEHFGWRWVFLGALGLLVPTWLALRPAIRGASSPGTGNTGSSRSEVSVDAAAGDSLRTVLPWSIGAAAAAFTLTLAGEQLEEHSVPAGATVLAAAVILVLCTVRLMPAGTFRLGRGIPAIIALRAAVSVAFGVNAAFLPLLLTLLHGFGATTAGISLSITGVSWAFGSWLQARIDGPDRITWLRWGFGSLTAGLAVTTLLAWSSLPVWVGLAGWTAAGIGIGMTSPTLSVLLLDQSPETQQGRNNSAAQIAGTIATVAGLAIAGTLLAFAGSDPGPTVFGIILTAGPVIGLLGLLTTPRARRP